MKYRFFIIILLILVSQAAFSQNDSTKIAHNLIYIEMAGVCGYGSVNYERLMFNKKHLMVAMRFGISSFHITDYTNKINPDILVPLSINGYYGKNNKIELGIGETFSNIVHANLNDFESKRISSFHTNFSIGYRYQKNTGGIIFRCTYTPIIEFNKYYRHWAGISLGYSF